VWFRKYTETYTVHIHTHVCARGDSGRNPKIENTLLKIDRNFLAVDRICRGV
jgi:hypothetical protein